MKSLVTALSFILLSAAARAETSKPNIIYIMADDLGWAELGSFGQKKIKTPHLDQLAAEGMRFTQHYTGSPVCAPARCSLMTGKHGGHAFVRNNFEIGEWESHEGQLPLKADAVTIAEVLKESGYATGAFGKWGLGGVDSEGDPMNQGFDRFYGYNCQRHAHNLFPEYLIDDKERVTLPGNDGGVTGATYGPQKIADAVLDFVATNKDKPFFLYYPTVIPHLALQVPDTELSPYLGEWTETPYTGKSYLPHPTPRAAYAAMITFMDKQIGRLMKQLDDLGLSENTVIFFTSDNGTTFLKDQVDFEFFESVGDLRGLKGEVYEGGIRVPLIVRWPGKIESGGVSELVSAHYDALPTIAEIAGVKETPTTDGISYLPTLLGQDQKAHDFLLWDFAGYGAQVAIRRGNWKAVIRDLKKNPDAEMELYDLSKDRSESKNLAAKNPELVEELTKLIIESRDEPETERFRFWRYE